MENLVYTSAEVAEILRTRPNTIIDMLNSGELPAYREGRNWKIPRECLERYIVTKAMKETKERRKEKKDV